MIWLTRIRYRPSAAAAFRVIVISPPFETEYGPSFGSPMYALTDPMLTIDPPPRAFIDLTASCRQRNGARRLTAMMASHSSTERVLQLAARGAGGVVDEHVEAAHAFDREADDAPAGLDVGEIAGDEVRLAAGAAQGVDDLAALLLLAAVNDDARAEGGEVLGDAAADPGGRAGYQGDFVGERGHSCCSPKGLRYGLRYGNRTRESGPT